MSNEKLAVILSPAFIEIVTELRTQYDNLETIARLAERRLIYRGVEAAYDIIITAEDVALALNVDYEQTIKTNYAVNLYTWLTKNLHTLVGCAKNLTKDTLTKVWNSYAEYVTANSYDPLWLKTKMYKSNNPMYSAFGVMCKNILDKAA